MKKQLLILHGTLIAIFFSIQFAAAAIVDTSVSAEETYGPNNTGQNNLTTSAIFPLPVISYAYRINNRGIYSDRKSKSELVKGLMTLTTMPLFTPSGSNKKATFLAISKEKVLFGSPFHKRFSYPVIALRIKF